MMSKYQSPLMLLTFALAAATSALFFVQKPWGPLALMGISLAGLVLRLRHLRQQNNANTVDLSQLKLIDFRRFAPWIKENLRGHDAVVDELASQIQQNLFLARPGRTLGNFLLVGPTGTGKTFLAHLVSQALFPDSEVLHLPMNQFKSPEDVNTLFGPPPGRGDTPGALTEPVLVEPKRVVLLDEIEKAHPEVQHALFNVLDRGVCQQKTTGRNVYFHGCVFIGTCNAGVELLKAQSAKKLAPELAQIEYRQVLTSYFDPAFLARWNHIGFMDALSAMHIAEVACLSLAKHWHSYGLNLRYTSPKVILETVSKQKEFEQYGVRQLAGYLRAKCDKPLSEALRSGMSDVYLDLSPDGDFTVAPAKGTMAHGKKKLSA